MRQILRWPKIAGESNLPELTLRFMKRRILLQKKFQPFLKESITIAVSGHNSLGLSVGKFHFEMTPSPDEYCQAFIIYTFEFTGEQIF